MTWPFGLLRVGHYGAIYADPPWAYRGYVRDGVPQTTSTQHYDTMTVEDLAKMPVHKLAAPDCALFMWGIPSHVPQAMWLAKQWGFNYSSKAFTWVKLNKRTIEKKRLAGDDDAYFMGMGHGTRRNTEDCWLFMRGNPKRLDRGVRELIVSPLRDHSRKPDEVYGRIERLVAGPYCELFGRNQRTGWSTFGNQKDKFNQEEGK